MNPTLIRIWTRHAPNDVAVAIAEGKRTAPTPAASGFMFKLWRNPPPGLESASWNIDDSSIRLHMPDSAGGRRVISPRMTWDVVDGWLAHTPPAARARAGRWISALRAGGPTSAQLADLLAFVDTLIEIPGEEPALFGLLGDA